MCRWTPPLTLLLAFLGLGASVQAEPLLEPGLQAAVAALQEPQAPETDPARAGEPATGEGEDAAEPKPSPPRRPSAAPT